MKRCCHPGERRRRDKHCGLARKRVQAEHLRAQLPGRDPQHVRSACRLRRADEETDPQGENREDRFVAGEKRAGAAKNQGEKRQGNGRAGTGLVIHPREGERTGRRRDIRGDSQEENFTQGHRESARGIDARKSEQGDDAIVVDHAGDQERGDAGMLSEDGKPFREIHCPAADRGRDGKPRTVLALAQKKRHGERGEPGAREEHARAHVFAVCRIDAERRRFRLDEDDEGDDQCREASQVSHCPSPTGNPANKSARRDVDQHAVVKRVREFERHLRGDHQRKREGDERRIGSDEPKP